MSEESDNDLYYDSDNYSESESEYSNSDEEMTGGAYELASDYMQYYDDDEYEDEFGSGQGYGLGYGMGGVLMGGAAAKKFSIGAYRKFFAAGKKKGLSTGQIAACWNNYKKSGKKTWVTSRCGPPVVRKKATSKTIRKPKRAMSKTMKKLPKSKKSSSKLKKVNFAPYDAWLKCQEKGMIYCPLTKRCRSDPYSAQDCYNNVGIPYKINKDGFPISSVTKLPNKNKVKYSTLKSIMSRDDADYFYRGRLLPMKKKKMM